MMNLLTPTVVMKQEDTLRERLADLEHEQWIVYAKDLIENGFDEERKKKWKELFIPYSKLSEEKKDLDKKFADKVIALLKQEKVLSMDGTTGKGGEWIATDMLKPKKKEDVIRNIY